MLAGASLQPIKSTGRLPEGIELQQDREIFIGRENFPRRQIVLLAET